MPTIHVNPDPCIACTTCTVFCPVAQATGEFLGPRMIGPALQRFRLLNMTFINSVLPICAGAAIIIYLRDLVRMIRTRSRR